MTINPATTAERQFTFAHDLPPEQRGLIGHLRGDFGSSGKEFWTTFFDAIPTLKTQAFKNDFDRVINHLRSKECDLLASRRDMIAYAEKNDACRYDTWLGVQYVFRIDTDCFTYLLRCLPQKGNYNFYCWCYEKAPLDAVLANP